MEQLAKLENPEGKSLSLATATTASQSSAVASSATHSNGGNPRNAPQQEVSQNKLSWEEQKKRDAERRKIEREVEKLEAEIAELEAKKAELENKMAQPEVYSNGEKAKAVQREIEEVSNKLEETNLAWMEKAELLG